MTILRTAAFWACLPWAFVASANDLSRDEEVVLFPTYAAFDPASETSTFPLHAWIFEPEEDSKWRGDLLGHLTLGITLTEQERVSPVFRQRGRMFLVDNERGQKLVANVAGHKLQLPASEANGHIRHSVTLPTADVSRDATGDRKATFVLRYSLEVPRGDPRSFLGRIHFIAAEGWSVVSDIDDTIKISNVREKAELMRNTFLRKFKPVDGMAARYTAWSREGVAFHYVSGSPWQLYPALADFTDEAGFPQGTFHLRTLRIQDGSARDMLAAPSEFKLAEIEKLLKDFPNRKFAFVGDSGELDPEVYGEIARRFPKQLRFVAIRNITDERLENTRMKHAFRDVPAERCLLFSRPEELPHGDGLRQFE